MENLSIDIQIDKEIFDKSKEDYIKRRYKITYYRLSSKLYDMSNDLIKQEIEVLKVLVKTDLYIAPCIAWIYIFQFELNKRRMNKLKKIKSNI